MNECMNETMEPKKFYQKNWFMYVWLILFPPVGIILLWTFHRAKDMENKVVITAAFTVWFVVLMVSSGGFSKGANDGIDKATSNTMQEQPVVQPTQEQTEPQKVEIDPVDFMMCMGNMKLVVENVVGEKFVHTAFDVKSFGVVDGITTVKAQYLPDGAGTVSNKVDITVVKEGNVYTTTEIMLAGNVVLHPETLPQEYVVNIDTGQEA